MPPALYTFIDEGGDFNFAPNGSKYFTITGVTVARPFPLEAELNELRFDLLEAGTELEYFHAAEDLQATRDKVFSLIQSELARYRVDSVIVEKCKTGPSLRPLNKIYPLMLGYLLSYIINGTAWANWSELIVVADPIAEKKKEKALEKAVKTTLKAKLPTGVPYRMLHQQSRSCYSLQVADYFNWAIYRHWNAKPTSLPMVRSAVKSQFDIFRRGTMIWY